VGEETEVWLAIEATGGVNPVPSTVGDFSDMPRTVRVFQRESRTSSRNSPAADTWFVFDGAGMAGRIAQPGASDVPVAEPVDLLIRNAEDLSRTRTTTNPYGAPRPIDPLPPQRHLGYALTWWGLAIALFVMYWVFHMSRGRLKFGA